MAIVIISTVVGQTLAPISKITIEALDGKKTIATSKIKEVDTIDDAFFSEYNQPGRATNRTDVMVYSVKTPVNFFGMLSSLGCSDLSKLWLTQAQIISFCENNPSLFKDDDFNTFFLCRSNDNSYAQTYFIVSVYFISGYKSIFWDDLGWDMHWTEPRGIHLVVPTEKVNISPKTEIKSTF